MHLKSLTLRGFKSFASATTLRFEPGITAVVGPNGSGKSNVVDAIAWVLGEQGAKALRGGKMEDVIFAGTSGRPPLGRAEVTLTIDNADGALPIEFAEVSITRRMFREGSSDYEINGESARLLDIQELLSDSGIGREMHVIVGQGQLDAVLQARPEDRRGFVEEAAGVLKHRKRKEKALRKLDAMQANLTRITDLTTELRRQLKPLGRQAEIARRAQGVQAELRDSRLRLLADDLLTLRGAVEREVADEEAIRARRAEVEAGLEQVRAREAELDAAMAADAPLVARARDTWYRLSTLEERLRGTASLAAERARHLYSASDEDERSSRDPDAMEAEATQVREQEGELQQQLDHARSDLAEVVEHRQRLERRLGDAERAVVVAVRALADRREGLARLTGQVNSLRTRVSSAADESERLAAAAADARTRAAEAEVELDRVQGGVGALDAGELGLDARHENAVAAFEAVEATVRELTAGEREAERERSTWTARADALVVGLTRKDGTDTLLKAGDALPGVRGSLADLLTVRPGYEVAIAAALGAAADAVAVDSRADAIAGLAHLRAQDAGRAALVVAGVEASGCHESIGLTDGAVWAQDVVDAPAELGGAIAVLLAGVVIAPDAEPALRLLGDLDAPVRRLVTRDGDVFGEALVQGGSASGPSAIEISASIDEARQKADEAASRHDRLRGELSRAREDAAAKKTDVESALEALHESDAALSAVAERLARLGQVARSASAEATRLDDARHTIDERREQDVAGLAELEDRLQLAEASSDEPDEPDTTERDGLQQQVADARQGELEARLQVRTGEERVRSLHGRAEQLLRAADVERTARRRRQEAREARARGAVVAAEVRDAAAAAVERIAASVATAADERDVAVQARAERETEAVGIRGRIRELGEELGRLTDAVHRDEVMRAEQRLRIEALEQRAADEYGVEPDTLATEYGPDQPCPPSAAEVAEYEQARDRGEQVVAPQPGPYDRAVQDKRAARAERDLALLGKVNPLALEEFAALEERHQFLSTQLEDLKATRRDLLTVVKEVDDRILEVFTAAYVDVAREFEVVFATLFPGGEGRLVLTEPDDMLLTGIEVEARPPGKKVKRLSLLSGGERSLVAVALLVAIFRARPSPFYVMDEIEAALDDVNLGRLLGLVAQLRESSQIIQITHQKRTMEIADALYGVTMRGDGVSQVISQRLRDAG